MPQTASKSKSTEKEKVKALTIPMMAMKSFTGKPQSKEKTKPRLFEKVSPPEKFKNLRNGKKK